MLKISESIIQQQICELLSILGIFYFSIPNERVGTNHAQRTVLKKMGLLPGMPDLAILANNTVYFLEVKTATGRLSEQQKIIHTILNSKNYIIKVVKSVEDVKEFLKEEKIV